MDAKAETRTILERLVERTTAHGYEWEVSDAEPDEYVTTTARFRYYIRSRDADGNAPFIFEVYAPETKTPGAELVVDSREVELQDVLGRLYLKARRSASGLKGEITTEILKDLDEHTPF